MTLCIGDIELEVANDSFLNAGKLCCSFGKQFKDYHKSDRTTAYILALAKELQTDAETLVRVTNGKATYIHPQIAIDLGRWLCPEFAVQLDKWFIESYLQKREAVVNSQTYVQKPPATLNHMSTAITLKNETDLHYKIAHYIRTHCSKLIVIAGLGEMQDSSDKRLDAFRKGYQGGQPDLIVLGKCPLPRRGYAIELKNPTHRQVQAGERQQVWLDKMVDLGFEALVSNDYDVLVSLMRDFQLRCMQHEEVLSSLEDVGSVHVDYDVDFVVSKHGGSMFAAKYNKNSEADTVFSCDNPWRIANAITSFASKQCKRPRKD